ncbi:MAG: deaminase [Chlamydiia bacterium]|nr:deaminase [Chlamydiia bacterium]
MHLYHKEEILKIIDLPFFMEEIEKGLVAFSQKKTILSPIGFLHFDHPVADVHMKSGAMTEDDFYVVKIASSFYENPKKGLPSSNGLMLLFSQKTGELLAILMDEGLLTDIRTGLVGAIAAKYPANKEIHKIGVIGTGTQAKEQLRCLQYVTSCREVCVWGRNKKHAEALKNDPLLAAFHISIASSIDQLAQECRLIVTTTPSSQPLLFGHQIFPGTHITAVGADGKGKQEIDASAFEKADYICTDSYAQSLQYGDFSYVQQPEKFKVLELGNVISQPPIRNNDAITIADLTGVAITDLQIAKAALLKLCSFS